MKLEHMIYDLYAKFYAQIQVLSKGPQLSMDVGQISIDNFDFIGAKYELSLMVAYMLGVNSIDQYDVDDILKLIKKSYENQPFWKALLLDYVDILNEEHKLSLKEQTILLKKQMQDVLDDIMHQERAYNAVVAQFAHLIDQQKFAVNAKQLVSAYFNMKKQDSEKAWATLITNPAYFSPIITRDKQGNVTLSPNDAKDENKKIAKFLKSLKL